MIFFRPRIKLGLLFLSLALCTLGFVLTASPAWAQGQTSGASSPPELSTAMAVVTVLSLLSGMLTQVIQTGTVLNTVVLPKTWLPVVTLLGTFVAGVVGYFSSQTPVVLNGASVFYAVAFGVATILTGAAPGIAIHAHAVVPAQMKATRIARIAASIAPAAAALALVILLGVSQTACTPAEQAALTKDEAAFAADMQKAQIFVQTELQKTGITIADIEQGVALIFPKIADLDGVISDIIDELIKTNQVSNTALPTAIGMKTAALGKSQAFQAGTK